MDDRVRALRANIARLTSLATYLEDYEYHSVGGDLYNEFRRAIESIGIVTNLDLSFLAPRLGLFAGGIMTEKFAWRISHSLQYIRERFADSLGLAEANLILEGLKDDTLRSRCGDLLMAESDFDRAVNQATLVLEARIRAKSQQLQLTGVPLVNAAIKSEIEKSVLVLSADEGEQRGFADIIRGVMAAHRNPTHHSIYDMSRLDAARICAYIDMLIELIERAATDKTVMATAKPTHTASDEQV